MLNTWKKGVFEAKQLNLKLKPEVDPVSASVLQHRWVLIPLKINLVTEHLIPKKDSTVQSRS